MKVTTYSDTQAQLIQIKVGAEHLMGELFLPDQAEGVILFTHSGGNARFSPRNHDIAERLHHAGFATLLINLLTPEEEAIDTRAHHFCFDVPLLASRIATITDWLAHHSETAALQVGYFGDDVGSAGAIVAAIKRPDVVGAIVSRSGRLDLADSACSQLQVPTLLIVGEADFPTVGMNTDALQQMSAPRELATISQASHQLEETGAIEQVARLATQWFKQHLSFAEQSVS